MGLPLKSYVIERVFSREIEPPGFLKTPERPQRPRQRRPGDICCSGCLEYWDQPEGLARISGYHYCHYCAHLAEKVTLRCRRSFEETLTLLFWGAAAGLAFTLLMFYFYGGWRP